MANRSLASGTPTARERSGPDPSAMNSGWTPKTVSYQLRDASRSRTVMPTWCRSKEVMGRPRSGTGPDEDLELVALRIDQRVEPLDDHLVERDLGRDRLG